MDLQLFEKLANKLNLNYPHIIRKAQEYSRLIDIKMFGNLQSLNLTGTFKIILTLELAAISSKTPCDRNIAVQLAGVPRKSYLSCLQTVEKILQLESKISVYDVCVKFGCITAKNLASNILKRYESDSRFNGCSSSMLIAASVYVACRKLKIKIDKKKLNDLARAKSSIFERLCSLMEEYASTIDEKETLHHTSFLEEMVETKMKDNPNKRKIDDDKTESYEEWKAKILASATKMKKT